MNFDVEFRGGERGGRKTGDRTVPPTLLPWITLNPEHITYLCVFATETDTLQL